MLAVKEIGRYSVMFQQSMLTSPFDDIIVSASVITLLLYRLQWL